MNIATMIKATTATTPIAAFFALGGGGLSIGICQTYPLTTMPPFG